MSDFIVINLQNSQWNSKEEPVLLKHWYSIDRKLADKEKRERLFDMATKIRRRIFDGRRQQ
jgi:hypothetical protein